MAAFIIKAVIAIFAFLTWAYTGGTFQESLFVGLMLFGILLLRPISFQSKEEREELLERERMNTGRMKDLHQRQIDEKKEIKSSANRRAQRSEYKAQSKS